MRRLRNLLIIISTVIFSSLSVNSLLYANMPIEDILRSIVGEASGESFRGKVAVAEAIRNRGHLRGVYGLRASHIKSQPKQVWVDAKRAWEISKNSNYSKGATGWGNKKDLESFKKTKWWKNCEIVAQVGGHYFYKEKKLGRRGK